LLVPPVAAETVELLPIKDNTLYEPISQVNFEDRSNALGPNLFAGKVKDAENQSGQVAVRRAVLAFDIAGNVPAGATIDAVQLTLVVNRTPQNTSFAMTLHRLLADWGEGTSDTGNSQQGRGEPPTTGDATWNHTFYPSQFWAIPGGDYNPANSASTSVGGTGTYNWGSTSGMVADVQFWLDNPSQNFGWILVGDESQIETAKRFASRENTDNSGLDKPRLIVNYTPTGGPTGACCATDDSCSIEESANCIPPSVYQGDGTLCSPNPCTGPIVAACCASDGTCTDQTQTDCEAGGGVFQGAGSDCTTADCPIELTPYVDALPLPPIATPTSGAPNDAATYDITMLEFEQQLHSELPNPTRVWGYSDGVAPPSTPGPIIVARQGLPVTVNWINDIRDFDTNVLRTDNHYLTVDVQEDGMGNVCIHGAEDSAKSVVHLHGGHVPADVDGYPESTYLPGSMDTYTYPNEQQAGYLWFHDHSLGITRLNVYMGLAGAYLLRDDVEDALNIPSGEFEVPIVMQDRKFNPDGSYQYPAEWQDMWFGDKVMVNGKVWPFFDVKQGKYRLKILNGSGSRVYTLSLKPPSGLLTFSVIGTEGGLLEQPVNGVGQLTLGPGERYDVVVDFANYNPGDEILLQNSAPAPFPNGTVDLTRVMKFVVTGEAGDTDPLPGSLRPIERLQEGDAILTRDFRLKRSGVDGCGRAIWEINDLKWDDITEYPELDTTEIWQFINDSNVSHPMHMHLVFFQILDRDTFTTGPGDEIIPGGNPQPPLAEEDGWKDTAMVGPNEILRVIVRFEDYKGRYAYHCHILEHEDHEMMRQFQTIRCGDAELDPTEGCDDGNLRNLDGCSTECKIEEFVELAGTADGTGGGRVDLIVSGELISVNTSSGQTAAEVAQALADAINANANLQALGIAATATGSRVVTTGDITVVDIRDNGLSDVLELSVQPTRMWWGNIEGATGYDIVAGSLNELVLQGGDFSSPTVTESCLANDQSETFNGNLGIVAPGEGNWYLLRSEPGGTFDSEGTGQIAPRDTAIGSSGNGCP
jgi:spore coat protein A